MNIRIELQLSDAFGPVNRWFCSEFHGREIDDKNLLVEHYVRRGGAKDFARRYEEAMGPENRWYCSQHHDRDIRDPRTLWEYYNQALARALAENSRHEPVGAGAELSITD